MTRRRFGLGSRDTRRGRASQFLYVLSFAEPSRFRPRRPRPRRPHPLPRFGITGATQAGPAQVPTAKSDLIAAPAPARVRELEDA